MIVAPNVSQHDIDASFFMDDEQVKKIDELQEVLYQIEESNFDESVDRIKKISFTSTFWPADIARNIIHISCCYTNKISLFVRLILELQSEKCNLIHEIELQQKIGIKKGAYFLFSELISLEIIKESHELALDMEIFKEKHQIQIIIERDDIERLKILFASPNFNKNKEMKFLVSPLIDVSYMYPIEFAAYCGSVKCFRFLYINDAILVPFSGNDIFNSAVAGGNIEIIQILEQAKIKPKRTSLHFAIRFHRVEIFDWLLERFSIDFYNYSIECVSHEFVHGFSHIKTIYPPRAYETLCECGLMSLARYFVEHFNVTSERSLTSACIRGDLYVVKQLLTFPFIDVNDEGVSSLLIWLFY